MTRTANISWKQLSKRIKSPFKPSKRDRLKSKATHELILQKEEKHQKMIGDWKALLSEVTAKGDIPESFIDKENFPQALKSLDKEMGFGHISSDPDEVQAKIVLQGKNPFVDNNNGVLSPGLGKFLPYSQIYNVNSKRKSDKTYFIVRHYLDTKSLTEKELNDIHVASCHTEEVLSSENIKEVDLTQSREIKTVSSSGKKKSSIKLLDQMQTMLRGDSLREIQGGGVISITVHKARNIEKKGLVGKADPYVVMQLGDQKRKSGTVSNNHNPVWHFTGLFNVYENDKNISFTVFDEDIGKDDFLGETNLDIEELRRSGEISNKVLNLEKCKSGSLTISAKFVPAELVKRSRGKLSLILHSAKKLEKKNKLKKADPYAVIKVGEEKFKSTTINNNNSPVWEFKVELEYMETSPRQVSIEVFDDDIGKDAPIGNVTVDITEVMKTQKIEESYKLENCKTGDIMISAFFDPADQTIVSEEIVVTKVTETKTSIAPVNTFPGVKLTKPLYIGDEFAVVDRDSVGDWFVIVSPNPSQPINVSIVPYKKYSGDSPVFLYCLPAGSFHSIRRVIHSGRGLRKCGFETRCVLRAGEKCELYLKDTTEECGEILPYTYGPDNHSALLKKGQQDFIDLIIKDSATGQLETELTLSFYQDLVDAA